MHWRFVALAMLGTLQSGCGGDRGDDPFPGGFDCLDGQSWPSPWVEFEAEVLRLVNEQRAQGATCGAEGAFPAAAALRGNDQLTCAARRHSSDMAHRNFFDHVNPDGDDSADRARAAGYAYQRVGENIALGQVTPAQVMAGWMASPGHCTNIMSDLFEELGAGFVSTDEQAEPDVLGRYWTQVFGNPL